MRSREGLEQLRSEFASYFDEGAKGDGDASAVSSEGQVSNASPGHEPPDDDDGDSEHTGTGTVWDNIKATQECYGGTQIPRSFEIDLGDQKIWVHGNATKHLYDDVINRGGDTDLYTQILLSDFKGALQEAVSSGIAYGETITVNNWTFKISPAKEDGLLPALIHAQFNGWGH